MKKFPEYKSFNLPEISQEISTFWQENKIFEKSLAKNRDKKPFVFYEGPPSANGLPGIHHVMARTIKDIFCRFKSQKGFAVERKAGWDTHGLPVELGVEKELNITKEDIGSKVSVADYNEKCRLSVMRYTDTWNDLTNKIGFWVDLENPYITYKNKYIESVWHLLQKLFDKNLLYKGYSVQPYSPAAGTGLSSHELNQPGCYRNVKDTSVVAQFKIISDEKSSNLTKELNSPLYALAWTTTPWTLPSNTALCIGKNINYIIAETFNRYTKEPISILMAEKAYLRYFKKEQTEISDWSQAVSKYKDGSLKQAPVRIVKDSILGSSLLDLRYEQLLAYAQPSDGDAFKVISGDFVSTEDGTGIVHIAPSFGSDDSFVAKVSGIGSLTLVDKRGKFTEEMQEFSGEFVKEAYLDEIPQGYQSVDIRLAIKLKTENKAFLVEKFEHNYPHCWRTDKPILYYPMDSWFIRTTSCKEKLIELNKQINWKPASTGSGRFGNWLENLQDWNLSRSRYWGIPIPIWSSEDKSERICIGSLEELKAECEKSVKANVMKSNPLEHFTLKDFSEKNYDAFDLHKPSIDEILLVSKSGKVLRRENDLIDVWFDSGSMPYAQWHYPFENKEVFEKNFPADFIAEGVDQTRGWFFTLHAISVMCFDSIAYKNVVSNGLVLDKQGQKMSKRLGNAIDPFETITKYGPDATRWYMISNAQPWDNLKFDAEGIVEVQRKFFRALANTYAFFALYANIDNFTNPKFDSDDLSEIDRWIISKLHSLIKSVNQNLNAYEPTKAARDIQEFTVDHLSNWYVRLSRRRFWKSEMSQDKENAYSTLYLCLETICKLAAPIAPFYCDHLFNSLNNVTKLSDAQSVHLSDFPEHDQNKIDLDLEEKMKLAQTLTSMVLGLRKRENLKVRQPLNRIMVASLSDEFTRRLRDIEPLLLSEINVKSLEILDQNQTKIKKKIKADFKKLGPRYGKQMKELSQKIAQLSQEDILQLESGKTIVLQIQDTSCEISSEDVEIIPEDIAGWMVSNHQGITVALDISLDESLIQEGLARELVNRLQNLRKESGFEIIDRITIEIDAPENLNNAFKQNENYIVSETLADSLKFTQTISGKTESIDIDDKNTIRVFIEKARLKDLT